MILYNTKNIKGEKRWTGKFDRFIEVLTALHKLHTHKHG